MKIETHYTEVTRVEFELTVYEIQRAIQKYIESLHEDRMIPGGLWSGIEWSEGIEDGDRELAVSLYHYKNKPIKRDD